MKKLGSCKGIIAVILFSLILTCFAGCHLWYQDLKGYLEHWSDTVSVEGTEWSASPESQKNSSGVDTVATNATISASVAISNPENYALNYEIGTSSDPLKSVRLTGATAILSSARVISSSPSSIQVQIAPLSAVPTPESLALEHSDFTLQFIPVRSDSGLAAPTAESITLRYNTPPRMPLEVVYNKDSQQLDWMGSEGWKLVQQAHDSHLDNHIYWAWPRGITDPCHPDYVTKFQIYVDGSLSQEGAPDNFKYTDSTFISPKLADYQVYRVAGTSGSKIEIYAVDPEDVTSFATGSGIAPHKITLTTDQGFFSSSGVDSLEVYKAAGSLAIGSDFEAPYNSDTRYYLSGWTCDGNPVSFPLEISKSMKLVAQWTSYPTDGGTGGTPGGDSEGITGSGSASSSTYSITYDANGADSGTVPASQTKLAGKTVTLAKNSGNLTKEHHTFSGWNTQADGKGQFYGEGTTYATDANVTLYAQWTKWNQVEPVHFDVGAGNVNFNTQVTLSTATPNATIHYTVNGSGEQNGAVGQPVVITITSDATISAYATYDGMIPSTETSANYKLYTYTITYDGNGSDGGAVPVQQTKIDGYPVELAGNTDNLTKTGYTFDGWNTAADGTGTSYAEGASYTKDAALTLYAQWKGVDYTITYDLDGGTNHSGSPQGYTVADLPLELKTPTKTGYTFKGWLIGDSSSPGTRIEQGVTGDITVTAQWQLNTYTVIFNGNNSTSGSTSSQIFTYGISQNLTPNGFQRTGYTFVDWNTAADGTGTSYANGASYAATGDITLYAQWNLNQDVDGKYIINDHTHLLWIAEQLEDGAITKFDLKLTDDIVIPSNTWEPISVIESSVDGQGHSITLVEDFTDSEGERFGLFGYFNYGTVENLVLKGSITAQVEPGEAGVGAVSGTAYKTTLRNVMSEVEIINKGTGSAGGLVGYFGGGDVTALIENCAVYADVTSTNGNAGGLVGATWGGNQWWSIRSSIYMGNITGSTKGAIIGSQGTVGGNTAYMSDIWYCEIGGLSTDIGAMPGAVSISGSRGIKKTADEIKNNGVSILGSAWELKTGASYPTLN